MKDSKPDPGTAERREELKELFDAALAREPGERKAFLERACGDARVRAEVESLLAHHGAAAVFEQPLSPPFGRALRPGGRLGRFELLGLLGSGGMGEVYCARDDRLGREVAIKVLPRELANDASALARFEREARATAALSHPNILSIHEFDRDGDVSFAVMELLEGETLRDRLQRGPLPSREALEIAIAIADGLAAAHDRGIVHRDLKPANVFLTNDGRVKILDFGLARSSRVAAGADAENPLSQVGTVIGTPGYMSPEQVTGTPVGAPSDVFSFGCMLYEMVSGTSPFRRSSPTGALAAVLREEPEPLTSKSAGALPTRLDRVIRRCLAKEPGERFEDGRAVARALRTVPSTAHETTQPLLAGPRGLRSRRPVVLAFGALSAVLALLVWRSPWFPGQTGPGGKPLGAALTLAVLPFQVLTTPQDIGYLGIGIADSIITRLAGVRHVRLRPTSAIVRYEKEGGDPREIGRALDVEHVLSGTIQRIGDRFRTSVQLVRMSDGVAIWGKAYDLDSSDLFRLQDAVAEQVTAALNIRLTAEERERVYRRYTENAAAFTHYLRGRSAQVRYTEADTLAAIEAFEKALELDPDYALAHAGVAIAAAQMRIRFAHEGEVARWEERAKEAARRTRELDPHLAEAHEAMAAIHRHAEFDWASVIGESTRALELNPSLDLPHVYLAGAFFHLGLPIENVDREIAAALAANPANRVEPLRVHGTAALFYGDFARAGALLEEAQRLSESRIADWYLGQAYWYRGERERGEALLAQVRGSGQAERRAQATLASFLAARGERAKAEALLASIREHTYVDHHVAYSLGVAHGQLGNRSEAIQWLRRAVESGFPCYPWFSEDPLLRPLHGDPEFRDFVAELRSSWEATKARYS